MRHITIWSELFPDYAERFKHMSIVAYAWMNTKNCALELLPKE